MDNPAPPENVMDIAQTLRSQSDKLIECKKALTPFQPLIVIGEVSREIQNVCQMLKAIAEKMEIEDGK